MSRRYSQKNQSSSILINSLLILILFGLIGISITTFVFLLNTQNEIKKINLILDQLRHQYEPIQGQDGWS